MFRKKSAKKCLCDDFFSICLQSKIIFQIYKRFLKQLNVKLKKQQNMEELIF